MLLPIDEDDDEEGETGEPPALLPFSQLVLEDINVDDGRRTSPGRFDDELVDKEELGGEMIVGRIEGGNCF